MKRNARNASSPGETAALHALLLFAETIDIVFRDIVFTEVSWNDVRAVPAHATN